MEYRVGPIRNAGLEAKWVKTQGRPVIAARKKGTTPWYFIDNDMWQRSKEVGILEAFDEHTSLGSVFYIKGPQCN